MKQKVFFIVCIKFHGCFLESTNYYDGLFNRVIKKNSDKRHMALKQQHRVQDSRNGDKQHKDGLKLTATEKNANTIVELTDGNMALTSSIRKMTSFVIQTRDIHNSPKRALLNCKCLQLKYLWYTNVDTCTFISLYRLPSLKLLLQYKFGGKKRCCKSSC